MIQVRNALFETNSSSTHSLVMCDESTFADYKNGKTVLDIYNKKFYPATSSHNGDLHQDENGRPVLNGKTYDEVEDMFYDEDVYDSDYDFISGYGVPWWILDACGGYYSNEYEKYNGVVAISVERDTEI